MKKRILIAVMALVMIVSALGLMLSASAYDGPDYLYEIEYKDGEYLLYLRSQEKEGAAPPVLTAGNIAIAVPGVHNLGFTAAENFENPHLLPSGIAGYFEETAGIQVGLTEDGDSYIQFHWAVKPDVDPEDTRESATLRQLIGVVSADGIYTVNDFSIVPWPKTAVWAILDANYPEFNETVWDAENGYYWGTYPIEDEPGIKFVDIGAADWSTFSVGVYNPKNPVKVTIKDHTSGDKVGESAFTYYDTSATGFYTQEITLSLGSGTYDLIIEKANHCTLTITNVTASNFTKLTELGFVDLPCGDVNENHAITLQDRYLLLENMNKAGTDADLNGDGYVTLADLDILMLPENYNHVDFTIDVSTLS